MSVSDVKASFIDKAPIQQEYNIAHTPNCFVKFARYITGKLGILVHGNLSQSEVDAKLAKFNVRDLLSQQTFQPMTSTVLSDHAQYLLYTHLKDKKVVDVHLHLLAYDEGNYVKPVGFFKRITLAIIHAAAGVFGPLASTKAATLSLHSYVRHFPGAECHLLPIHKAFHSDGTKDWEATGSFLKNRVAINAANEFQNKERDSKIKAAVSIHPLDPKWEKKMEKAHKLGIRLIKWMPPQGIQPDSEQYTAFYQKMIKMGMTLLAHAGPEHTFPSRPEWEDWGNPLRFRMPLKLGVNVILAHCGHKDLIPDLDQQPVKGVVPKIHGYELFLRLAKEKHAGNLYADLSAVHNHGGSDFVREMLKNTKTAGARFLYGSDFPYIKLVKPGNDPLKVHVKADLLSKRDAVAIKEIRDWNPLIANYILARCLRYIDSKTETYRFPEETFTGAFKDAPLSI